MNLGVLTASASHAGGGIYEVVRRGTEEIRAGSPHKVEVFALEDEWSRKNLPVWRGVAVNLFPVTMARSFGYSPLLSAALREADIDLLHVHGLWMYTSVASLRWGRHARKPHMISTHGMLDAWALRHSHWRKILAAHCYERRHLESATCLHAVSLSEVNSIRAYGLRNPVCLIPFGVDIPDHFPVPPKNTQRRTLLFLGRLHPKKGLVNLLRAWRELGRTGWGDDWTLTIAGWNQSRHEQELRQLRKELGLDQRVFFLGPQFGAEKTKLLAEADAFVLPSFSEGLPVSVLEAWAHALPVLMTPECNIPQGFQEGAALPIGTDVRSVVQGLNALISMTDAQRASMGALGRRFVEKHFSWPVVASRLVSVYDWVIGGGVSPECVVST
jgi:poly(glycerol-phosphate) alpha-glucosyltransferase